MKRILSRVSLCALVVAVLMVALPASVSAQPIEIYVGSSFIDDPPNHVWNTIQEGINDARDNVGDTVYVYAGTYNENVVINKRQLTVWGQSRSLVTVNGGAQPYTMEITADNVTVRQLTISGGTSAAVYWHNAGWGKLFNSDVSGSQDIGILLLSITNQEISCNNVYSNIGRGIQVTNSTLKDIIRNEVYDNGGNGISLQQSTAVKVVRNRVHNNGVYGIFLDSASTINKIYLNDFFSNPTADGYSQASGNKWETSNTPYLGNYWGDYAGSDGDSNGIGDTPHALGTEVDDWPLMSSHVNYTPASQDEPAPCTPEQAPPAPPTPTPTPTPPPGGGGDGGGCFIATAALGPDDSSVLTLRNFRDGYMATSSVGSSLISAYYRLSPPIARFIDDHPALKPIVRAALLPAVAISTLAVNTALAEKAAIASLMLAVSALAVLWLRRRAVASELQASRLHLHD
ncbi:MAG: CFI-box-CTERM domain-containing protein [Dehalococcoidia bacterium]